MFIFWLDILKLNLSHSSSFQVQIQELPCIWTGGFQEVPCIWAGGFQVQIQEVRCIWTGGFQVEIQEVPIE